MPGNLYKPTNRKLTVNKHRLCPKQPELMNLIIDNFYSRLLQAIKAEQIFLYLGLEMFSY